MTWREEEDTPVISFSPDGLRWRLRWMEGRRSGGKGEGNDKRSLERK